MSFIQAKCPVCGGMLAVDDAKKTTTCQFCNNVFVIEDAVNNYNTYNTFNSDNSTTHNYSDGTVVNVYESQSSTSVLLKRVFMLLEDGDFERADDFCEQVLNIDPESSEAYIGKLMAELKVKEQESLKDQSEPFDKNANFQKAVRFANEDLKATLIGYIEYINTRNEQDYLNGVYSRAKETMCIARTEDRYKEAARLFESIREHLDSAALAKECLEKAEVTRKDAVFSKGTLKMTGDTVSDYEAAIELFESIPGWKDADEKIAVCRKKIEELKSKEEAELLERKQKEEAIQIEKKKRSAKRAKNASIVAAVVCVLVVSMIIIIPAVKYNSAVKLMNSGKFTEAVATFETLNGYKDSADKINECQYNYAISLLDSGKLGEASNVLMKLGDYKDAVDKSDDIINQLKGQLQNAKVGDYVKFGKYEQDNNTSNGSEEVEWLVLDVKEGKILVVSKYVIDYSEYNSEREVKSVYWVSSSIRHWLNNFFTNNCFSSAEKAMISTEYNSQNEEQDYVFLLNNADAKNYFSSDEARQTIATKYAIAKGANADGNCGWWLLSPGYRHYKNNSSIVSISDATKASYVQLNGVINDGGNQNFASEGVRPALWIDVNS